ncbi:hypothetical protein Syun_019670 [Stephania yunnanensis]|uniref:Uncharacterized protein n=1 Tax=Stephania yunnanensis TaxID=152371 RepID=A0AAP0IUK9_9MAGN
MNVPAIHGGLLKPDVVEGTDDERVWRLPCWDLTETSKRDDGIDLLKDNQALRAFFGTDDKAKMDLSSLTQTNIRMVEVIWNTWLITFGAHNSFRWDERMSLGPYLHDRNTWLVCFGAHSSFRWDERMSLGSYLHDRNTWLVTFGAHSSFRWDEMMSLGSYLMDVNVALIKVHPHWLLPSDGESEMLQSCVIVII